MLHEELGGLCLSRTRLARDDAHLVRRWAGRGVDHVLEGAVGNGEDVGRLRSAVANVAVLQALGLVVNARDALEWVHRHKNLTNISLKKEMGVGIIGGTLVEVEEVEGGGWEHVSLWGKRASKAAKHQTKQRQSRRQIHRDRERERERARLGSMTSLSDGKMNCSLSLKADYACVTELLR